ncbi:response regulator [Roseivirga sp.]|uniref:response regulator n=1 Tax=Roseivirga sp. TaxID=1964215 RepID=UPI003B51AAFC
MSKVKILVVEDEMVIADNICLILEDLGYEVLEPAINYEEAVQTIESDQPDIAILDIQLGGKKDGVDLAWQIKENYNIPFIFLTSNADAGTIDRVKKVSPPAYLVKPFKKDDLYTSIELALHNYAELSGTSKEEELLIRNAIFVKDKNLFHKIKLDDIRFLKSDHVYVEVHTTNNHKHLIRGSLTDLSERLPKNFYRTHRSYTINVDHMDAVNSAYVLIGQEQIPIGKNYREDLLRQIRIE